MCNIDWIFEKMCFYLGNGIGQALNLSVGFVYDIQSGDEVHCVPEV